MYIGISQQMESSSTGCWLWGSRFIGFILNVNADDKIKFSLLDMFSTINGGNQAPLDLRHVDFN